MELLPFTFFEFVGREAVYSFQRGSNMDIKQYVAEEMEKYDGVSFPIKSSMIRRLWVWAVKCKDLHPNPEDEFCNPDIGPSFRIISEYQHKLKNSAMHPYGAMDESNEPIIVERMYPEGYMIVNGHHRWAAAMLRQKPYIEVKIVNLTHEADVKKMLSKTKNDKRVALDLDEVVFGKEGEDNLEKKLPFPFDHEYKQRLRSGIPALFNYLNRHDYDVWVYTSNYYSFDYLKQMFKRYHVKVNGVITGNSKRSAESKNRINKMILEKYKTTVHVDRKAVLKTFSDNDEFIEKEIIPDKQNWSLAVMKLMDEIEAADMAAAQ